MTDMNKICEGCLSYERVSTLIYYGLCPGYKTKDIDCPCQHCLIKVMCNTVCDLLKERQWYKDYGVMLES